MNADEVVLMAKQDAWLDSEEAAVALLDPRLREAVYGVLHPRPSVENAPLLRLLLEFEMGYREEDGNRAADEVDFFENLYWCAFLLFAVGDPEDCLPLWRAKYINMDTGAGLDIQFLVGAGVEATMGYLAASDEPDAMEALNHLRACKENGSFDALDSWYAGRATYFGVHLKSGGAVQQTVAADGASPRS